MIKNDSQAPSCTCPSGDGSLVHPCPAHPAVEQAGGDERAAFEAWATHLPMDRQPLRPDLYMPQTQWAWEAWQFRAALAQPSPAPELAERGTQHRFSTTEQTCRHDFAGVWWNDNGVTKTGRECRHCGFFVADAPEVQAEAERPELWAVHAQGPDELYAAFTREDAEKHAAELNALPMPEGIAVGAVVVPSPWPAVQHWQYLAEQEQDHKNEITGRLRQLERICEGLPQDAIDGGWTVQGIRGYAKRLEDQLKAALARVAELEMLLRKLSTNGLMQFSTVDEEMAVQAALGGAPVAQAGQVPQAWLDVQAERRRQVEAEGWTPEHDDGHSHGQMARAAACYALAGSSAPNDGTAALLVSLAWPWDEQWWKPSTARRDLVKACALALAEIERLDRAAATQGGPRDA
ncbi:hypothetical protein ACH2GM_003135 [Pseudomonas aeruginosa]|uniref:hypothetical protein n=1 Tax=Pseudomonas aeruginosa TaxID=287 RepID=UPI000AEBE753|nr:hypothetical protein [Pseudomonas aeruginosa]MDY1085269.1 hypothetical protein [Pseudomonas aeruginosa]PUV65172.1 hypothetical protein DDK19_28520 [Pseudomonas aeruginosa]HBP1459838.1 hypothetical protein [Pseudomonas aeruginosa]